ncbi:MAG: hypothetical protein PF479_05650, partial [Oceanispirochaeta sp.]|nr:hypothetical protein [Oceanispirochaeta sp.]
MFNKAVLISIIFTLLLFGCSLNSKDDDDLLSDPPTPTDPTTPPDPSDTIAPSDTVLTVISAGAEKISLSWSEPDDSDYAHLLLSWNPGGTTGTKVVKGTTVYEIAGLTNELEYSITGKS